MNLNKDLISDIVNFKVDVVTTASSAKPNEMLIMGDEKTITINIFELMNKAKDWAVTKGFCIESGKNIWESTYYCRLPNNENFTYLGVTEQEAVFKACFWIFKQGKK